MRFFVIVSIYISYFIAVLDYEDYERMKSKKKAKKEGLLKNPVNEVIPEALEPKDIFQEQVAVNKANEDFQIKTGKEKEAEEEIVKVLPRTSVNSDPARFSNVSTIDLTKHVSESYMKNAKKMLEKVNLGDYRGGIFVLDSSSYNNEDLDNVMEILYGKTQNLATMKISGKSLAFIKSLYERNLKKFVKNKSVFKFVKSPFEWWNLNA